MTLSRFLFIIILSATMAGIGACRDNVLSVAEPNPNDSIPGAGGDTLEIMPLAVGNRWIYRLEDLDSLGNVLATSYDTVAIIDRQMIDGEWWYEDNSHNLFANRNDGLWCHSNLTPEITTFLVKYPGAAVGETYVMDTSEVLPGQPLILIYTRTVISTDTTITVPAGTYHGIQYRSDADNVDGSPYIRDWGRAVYTPGIGFIQGIGRKLFLIFPNPYFDTFMSRRTELVEVVLQ